MNISNKLTVSRIVLIPIFIIILTLNPNDFGIYKNFNVYNTFLIADFIFILASVTDYLDGFLARKYNFETTFGKFFDPLADKLLVLTAFVFLTSYGIVPAWITSVIVIRELFITGFRTIVLEKKGSVVAAALPGKIKTFSQMFSIIFLLSNNFGMKIPLGTILLYIATFFTIYSLFDYINSNKDVFKETN